MSIELEQKPKPKTKATTRAEFRSEREAAGDIISQPPIVN